MTERNVGENLDHTAEGVGGLGKLYVDVYTSGAISMTSHNIFAPDTPEEQIKARKSSWSAGVAEGASELAWERSLNGENEDFGNPASNRPTIEDVESLINRRNELLDKARQEADLEVIRRIREAFQKPFNNAALGHAGMPIPQQ